MTKARYVENLDGVGFLVRNDVPPEVRADALYCVGSGAAPVRPILWTPGVRVVCPVCGRLAGLSPKRGRVFAHYATPIPWRYR